MSARAIAAYVAEFMPTNATPAAPCQCGDMVFYQLTENALWRCRTCVPPGHQGWRIVACRHSPPCEPPDHIRSAVHRWFVVPRS